MRWYSVSVHRPRRGSEITLASTREIRRRIKSVKNIAQVTKAMEAVSAAKMRKAQQQVTGDAPVCRAGA